MGYYVETIRNRRGRDTVLLRHDRREGRAIRKKTIANLTDLPVAMIHGIDAVVRGGPAFASPDQAFAIARSRPYGHVTAVLGPAVETGTDPAQPRPQARQDADRDRPALCRRWVSGCGVRVRGQYHRSEYGSRPGRGTAETVWGSQHCPGRRPWSADPAAAPAPPS